MNYFGDTRAWKPKPPIPTAHLYDPECRHKLPDTCEDFKDQELVCPGLHIRKTQLPPCCKLRTGFKGFLVNNCGHLLPWVKRDPFSSPWGDYPTWEWERMRICDCVPCRPCRGRPRPCHRNKFSKLPKFFCESPRVICTSDEDEFIEDENTRISRKNVFASLRSLKVPIIWIYGFPDDDYSARRENFGIELARFFNMTYINMEEEMINTLNIGTSVGDNIQDPEVQRQASEMLDSRRSQVRRALETKTEFKKVTPEGKGFEAGQLRFAFRMAKRLKDSPGEGLNPSGVVELIKVTMLNYFPTNGFVIDCFPISEAEASLFEDEIYPMACGIYFQPNAWTNDKYKEPNWNGQNHFRRDYYYTETELERFIDANYKSRTLRILNADDTQELKEELIYKGVAQLLMFYSSTLSDSGPESKSKRYIVDIVTQLSARPFFAPEGGWVVEPEMLYKGESDEAPPGSGSAGSDSTFDTGADADVEDEGYDDDEDGSFGAGLPPGGSGGPGGSTDDFNDGASGSGSNIDMDDGSSIGGYSAMSGSSTGTGNSKGSSLNNGSGMMSEYDDGDDDFGSNLSAKSKNSKSSQGSSKSIGKKGSKNDDDGEMSVSFFSRGEDPGVSSPEKGSKSKGAGKKK